MIFLSAASTFTPPVSSLLSAADIKQMLSAAPLAVPFDASLRAHIHAIVQQKKKLNPKIFLLIGIGGSNMGTLALHQAIYGTLYNDMQPNILFYCLDTLDTLLITQVTTIVEHSLAQGATLICNIISKSGTTLETIAHAAFFIDLIKKYHPSLYQQQIVITTDQESPLWQHAQHNNYTALAIPKEVGGRYSVFSAVGLFPLAFLGIDIEALHAGARNAPESAAMSAVALFHHYKKGVNIHDTFFFSPRFAYLGAWYRQLMAESLGKQYTLNGEPVHYGMTPTISIGSTDLHSVVQLYLAGPSDKITTFVYHRDTHTSSLHIPDTAIAQLHPHINTKSITHIHYAVYEGTKAAYRARNCPYLEIILEDNLLYNLGQFMQFKMQEIILLGYLLRINPFDQPAVEMYKAETKKLLLS